MAVTFSAPDCPLQVNATGAAARELLDALDLPDEGWCTGYDLMARCGGVLEQPPLSDEAAFEFSKLLIMATWARGNNVRVAWMTHTLPPRDPAAALAGGYRCARRCGPVFVLAAGESTATSNPECRKPNAT